MRILAVADFHGKPDSKLNLSKYLDRGPDCIVIIGDLTQFGPVRVGEEILEPLKDVNVPILCVPGNCDPKEIVGVLDKLDINLHGKRVEIEGLTFIGLGGSNITPFNTLFEFTENEIWEELSSLVKEKDDKLILVTHAPPYNTRVDECQGGAHAGSKSVRRFIEEKHPLVNLCAHIHEARNIDRIGNTLLVNPGPISEGYAALVEVNEKEVKAELLGLSRER